MYSSSGRVGHGVHHSLDIFQDPERPRSEIEDNRTRSVYLFSRRLSKLERRLGETDGFNAPHKNSRFQYGVATSSLYRLATGEFVCGGRA